MKKEKCNDEGVYKVQWKHKRKKTFSKDKTDKLAMD